MTAMEIMRKTGLCNSCGLPLGEEYGRHEMMDSFNTLLHLFPEGAMGIYKDKKPETSFFCTKCALNMEKINSKIYNSYVSTAMQQEMIVEIKRHLETQEVIGVEIKEKVAMV